ncbi:hypothetical protein MMPV_007446 [Pyropia vietnamensis]
MADVEPTRHLPDYYLFLLTLDAAAVPAAVMLATAPVTAAMRSWAGPATPSPRLEEVRDGGENAKAGGCCPSPPAVEMVDALEGPLWTLWGAIHTAAMDTPAARQGALVDLLFCIAALPPPSCAISGAAITVWDAPLWSGLPIWVADVRETFNFDPSDPEDATPWAVVAWPRFNAFLARVVQRAAASADGAVVDGQGQEVLSSVALQGLWALREGLEDVPTAAGEVAMPVTLHAAAVWMVYAAQDGAGGAGAVGAPEGRTKEGEDLARDLDAAVAAMEEAEGRV